ncbi:flavin reductase [Pandoraea eparura]|jgi:flavin reductase (DIM6/NTAB) family NADH-FMN oxidoreductase RutF|uniref:Flavin reductase n=1 Tax=Pandoraea eparura TaxID=2508291 RepID=A0A5E4UDD3_9BURK|nr:hypothetical protein [Pandoraea eparura]VVD97683.1 flavin reductase [Pandoraea eparura]
MTERLPVELSKAYRPLNHGPTVLVGGAHDARRNVMAAAWSMPLDFSPPKVAVVIDRNTLTRERGEAAWADPSALHNGHWQVEPGAARSLHYIAGGHFFETGEAFEVKS